MKNLQCCFVFFCLLLRIIIQSSNINAQPTVDLCITEFKSPQNGCGLTSQEPVSFIIENKGTVGVPAGDAFIFITIEGPVNSTLPYPLPIDTAIPALSSICYTMPGVLANVSIPATYTIIAAITTLSDTNQANDTTMVPFANMFNVNFYPYYESFDGLNPGWYAGGINNSWALGTPNKNVIQGASSFVNAWINGGLDASFINLNGNPGHYNNNEQSYVQGPCFDMSCLSFPEILLDVWWNTEFSNDGAALQTSIDAGATWQTVGNFGDPDNWYNDSGVNGLSWANNNNGWTGTGSNGSGGWLTTRHELYSLAGHPQIYMRIAFGSDGSVSNEGLAFDNIIVREDSSLITCNIPSGLTSVVTGPTTATISWNAIPCSFGYELTGGAEGNPSTFIAPVLLSGENNTSFNVSGLCIDFSYEWTVRTICVVSGTDTFRSNYAALSSFTTDVCGDPSPPSTSLSGNDATLIWAQVNGVLGYLIKGQVNGGSIISITIPGGSNTQLQVNDLVPGVYSWQVQPICALATACSPIINLGAMASDNFTVIQPPAKTISATSADKDIPVGYKIYPNPTSDFVIVHRKDSYSRFLCYISLYNIDGTLIIREQVVITDQLIRLDLQDIPNGLYHLVIEDEESCQVEKLTITN